MDIFQIVLRPTFLNALFGMTSSDASKLSVLCQQEPNGVGVAFDKR